MEEAKLSETLSEAKRFEDEGQVVKAIECYTSVIDGCQVYLQNTVTQDSSNTNVSKLLALAYNNRGYLKYLQVDFDEASEDYTCCLGQDRTMYMSFHNRGMIHYRLGRFSQAVEDLTEALKLQPDFEPAQKCLEQSLIDLKRTRTSAR
ncbi:tetratricopeptide repeat protein 32-like [Liolophura sinensis]|uniref:tetratricopeptide repeat protein 32-like n=1 Tax=Liolophura sinensis TaxID=3198878 RepID=UPI00315820FC